MAQYNITLSDGVTVIPIPDGSTTITAADIPLVGQNTQLYGAPVATAHLFHLENFANDTAPSINTLDGQLWYDNGGISGTASLTVYDGTSFVRIANTGVGATESSTVRWNDTTKAWQEENRVRISDAGELLIALDGTASNVVTIQHDGTDLNVVGTAGTTDINVTGITAVNLPAITLVTALVETDGGTGTDTYTTGDILYSDGANSLVKLAVGSNGELLTLAGGVPTWSAAGSSISSLDDLSDVTLTAPANDSLLYRSGGQYIDSNIANLSFDGTDLSATQIGGIVEANLIDRSSPGTLAATIFSGNITAQADIILGDSDEILFGTGTDVRVDFDGTDFVINGPASGDFTITGFGAGNVISSRPVHATSSGTESFRAVGDASTWSTTDSYMSFYDSDETEHGMQIGTLAADGTGGRVNARLGNLSLYASNTLAMTLTTTSSTIHITGGIEAMEFRNPFVVGTNATTSATVGDINNAQYNVGFNETPTQTIVSSRDIGVDDIGKFLTRTSSTSRALTVVNDTGIPVGGSCIVHNAAGGGTLTIVPDGGITLTWVDGSGSTPASATRTIDNNSVVTLRKVSSTVWQIWGNGIS